MGWIAESKECNYKHYGWYCISARQQGFEPLPYEEWKELGCPKKYKK